MTGSFILSEDESLDVRTVDFERIADVFRHAAATSAAAKKLLVARDDHGMDMLCADELNSEEFFEFYVLLDDVRMKVSDTPGLVRFVDQVKVVAKADKRLAGKI